MSKDHGTTEKNLSPDSLESAIQAVERSLRANGIDDGGIPEGEQAGFEWRALFDWAETEGLISDSEVAPERTGGREHDLTHNPDLKQWTKFTKPDLSGYTVELVEGKPMFLLATPLQYLRRLQLQNSVWGDDIRLLGIQKKVPGARIITSQPDLVGGAASVGEIHQFLTESHAYRLLDIPPMGYYKSASYLRGNLGLFDVHPANFVKTQAEGQILPIDVIMVEFSSSEASDLARRLI